MKAQKMFGGTKLEDHATKVRQVKSSPVPTKYVRKETVKQVASHPATPHIKFVNSKQVGSCGKG